MAEVIPNNTVPTNWNSVSLYVLDVWIMQMEVNWYLEICNDHIKSNLIFILKFGSMIKNLAV